VKKGVCLAALVMLTLWSTVVSVSAHHTWPVSYSKLVKVTGTVTEVKWVNPHPMITLQVRNGDGVVETWLVGGPAPSRMQANGWTMSTVKPGDVITGIGYQYQDGEKVIRLEKVVLADGKEMPVYGR
jgi:hypothetical protein